MTWIGGPSIFKDLEGWMEKRKIRDEADARACLGAAKKSGLSLAGWGRGAGVDGRSLHAWSMNLSRGARGRHRRSATRASLSKPVQLVELVAAAAPASRGTVARYTVRVGGFGVEVGDCFDPATLRRLVTVLSAC